MKQQIKKEAKRLIDPNESKNDSATQRGPSESESNTEPVIPAVEISSRMATGPASRMSDRASTGADVRTCAFLLASALDGPSPCGGEEAAQKTRIKTWVLPYLLLVSPPSCVCVCGWIDTMCGQLFFSSRRFFFNNNISIRSLVDPIHARSLLD